MLGQWSQPVNLIEIATTFSSTLCIYVMCCPLPLEPGYLNFILCSPGLIRPRGYKPVHFPTIHLLPFVPTPGGHDDV